MELTKLFYLIKLKYMKNITLALINYKILNNLNVNLYIYIYKLNKNK